MRCLFDSNYHVVSTTEFIYISFETMHLSPTLTKIRRVVLQVQTDIHTILTSFTLLIVLQ